MTTRHLMHLVYYLYHHIYVAICLFDVVVALSFLGGDHINMRRLFLCRFRKTSWPLCYPLILHLVDFRWVVKVMNKLVVHCECSEGSTVHRDHFWASFLINACSYPAGVVVINVLAWKTFCKGLGFLGLRCQPDHSKFFSLVNMHCWISDV